MLYFNQGDGGNQPYLQPFIIILNHQVTNWRRVFRGCDHDLHNLAINMVASKIMWLAKSKYRGGHGYPIKFYIHSMRSTDHLFTDINKHKCSFILEWSASHRLSAQLALTLVLLTKQTLCEMRMINNASKIALWNLLQEIHMHGT